MRVQPTGIAILSDPTHSRTQGLDARRGTVASRRAAQWRFAKARAGSLYAEQIASDRRSRRNIDRKTKRQRSRPWPARGECQKKQENGADSLRSDDAAIVPLVVAASGPTSRVAYR